MPCPMYPLGHRCHRPFLAAGRATIPSTCYPMRSFFPCMAHLTFAIPFSQMQCRDVAFPPHSSMCLLTSTLQHQRSRPLPDRIEVLLMMIWDVLGPTTSRRISMSVAFVCMLHTWMVSSSSSSSSYSAGWSRRYSHLYDCTKENAHVLLEMRTVGRCGHRTSLQYST